ncbi:MAG: hypothetical protein E6G75_20375 [Alphaproteobacteria bacterium]|nr:MAG: hypothetical protein E6G75_20375 [Alphaproteobacteria bacterium]
MSVDVVTFGCRLNAYEAEVIRRQAQAAGLADAVVVNTCAVTAEAVRKSRQAIRKLKREHPDAPIVVAACAAAVAAVRLGLVGRTVTVTLPGGELRIEWRAHDDHVLMTGPVAYEYEGKFDPALFDLSATQ